jgi:hypothetical protein
MIENKLTRGEVAWELVALFDELRIDEINELLAKNVPMETLEFFSTYSDHFAETYEVAGSLRKRIPNLLLVGYLQRLLEERLLDDENPLD